MFHRRLLPVWPNSDIVVRVIPAQRVLLQVSVLQLGHKPLGSGREPSALADAASDEGRAATGPFHHDYISIQRIRLPTQLV